ncbi:hypothetical protein K503DRAFT_260662 [Rhizopogon vinicolor AM-OR11-026]|uniref:Uncharacterized protein n=1 Tax=Rhizopogon vinicolor AM-OR11-026 TaxID=1314800 RepID=A0A1B7MWP0_9AGAM|nr:hypothetical protein K503DRAFT_260662 [Rhizopogon vinicolor AM-OR11-026]
MLRSVGNSSLANVYHSKNTSTRSRHGRRSRRNSLICLRLSCWGITDKTGIFCLVVCDICLCSQAPPVTHAASNFKIMRSRILAQYNHR